MKKHFWVYVLELNEGKYYIGITTNPSRRIEQHKSGYYSAQWVKQYGYKSTLQLHDLGEIVKEEAEKTEAILTRDLIKQYGTNNVRGGDLFYKGKYFYRFGKFHEDNSWEAIVIVSVLMAIIFLITAGYIYEKYFV